MSTKQKESTKLRGLIRIGVFSALWTVSYTHLDVYKRQATGLR